MIFVRCKVMGNERRFDLVHRYRRLRSKDSTKAVTRRVERVWLKRAVRRVLSRPMPVCIVVVITVVIVHSFA